MAGLTEFNCGWNEPSHASQFKWLEYTFNKCVWKGPPAIAPQSYHCRNGSGLNHSFCINQQVPSTSARSLQFHGQLRVGMNVDVQGASLSTACCKDGRVYPTYTITSVDVQ